MRKIPSIFNFSTGNTNNILILKKTSKLKYLISKYGLNYIQNSDEYDILNKSMIIQEENTKKFISNIIKLTDEKKKIKIIDDCFLNNEYIIDQINQSEYDQVFSLGGDGTFLRSVTLVKKGNPLFIGVNTDLKRSFGYYCSLSMADEDIKEKLSKIIFGKNDERRINKIKVECKTDISSNSINDKFYFINDMYFGEKFSGRVSKFNIELDIKEIEDIIGQDGIKELLYKNKEKMNYDKNKISIQNKGSGIIFSTCKFIIIIDHGYTGWIQNSNSISISKYENMINTINNELKSNKDKLSNDNIDKIDKSAFVDYSHDNSIQTVNNYKKHVLSICKTCQCFPCGDDDKNKIFYYVREPMYNYDNKNINEYLKYKFFEGKVTKLSLKSYCYEGNLIVDGSFVRNLRYGDSFDLSVDDEKLRILEKI